jgi:glycolate oxidase
MTTLHSLRDIVGSEFVSNHQEELYLYSRDSGSEKPRTADYVVMPKTVEEIQKIIELANQEKIPITPMGGGFTLNGLAVPQHGGLVLDMKRMDRILEVNEQSRYVLIEAGVSQGALFSYLNEHHPHLQYSQPDAPPIATIAGNIVIHGHGHLSVAHGSNSEMVNGLEVVLPTGEVCKLGSSSLSPYWFARDPLPDLMGLFLGWYGTTGVVTKVSLQLFPKPKYRDLLTLTSTDYALIPDFISELIQLNLLENLFIMSQEWTHWTRDILYTPIVSAQDKEEFAIKIKLIKNIVSKYKGRISLVEGENAERMRKARLPVPPSSIALQADIKKGGGFQYTGGILPIEKIPEAFLKAKEISHKYGQSYILGHQVLKAGHGIMFGIVWCLNRADKEDIETVRQALEESNRLILDLGGVLWKAEKTAQTLMMQRMDPNTAKLMQRIKTALDPNTIMNPGNWCD